MFEREPEVHPGLLACGNAVLLPHLGSATVKTRLAMADLAADNLLAALEDRRPPTLVNPQALGNAGQLLLGRRAKPLCDNPRPKRDKEFSARTGQALGAVTPSAGAL